MKSRRERDLDEEIEDYLERETRDNIAAGMTPEEARLAARRKLGPTLRVKEDTRAAWGWTWLERAWQDLRYACRMLKQSPGFALIAVVSIALGVGVNCALFSVADALVLKPLPVARPGEIFTVGAMATLNSFVTQIRASYPDYVDLRDRVRSFDGLVAVTTAAVGFARQPDATPRIKFVSVVSGNFFDVLGVRPQFGRAFLPEEDRVPGRDAVVVLSHDLWAQEFGADLSILGRKIRLSGIEFTVVGIAPESFTGLNGVLKPAFYTPMMMVPRLWPDPSVLETRAERALTVKGRMKRGVTQAQAQAEISGIAANLERAYPDSNRNQRWVVESEIQSRIAGDPNDATMGLMLLTLSALVLLVACANVAGLLTSRAPARAREIAVRLAIGAGRWRLIRQMLTESALLALGGGVLGLAVARAGILLLKRIQLPSDLISPPEITLDERGLWVALAISVMSVALFGLTPAIRSTRADLTGALKAADAAAPSKRGGERLSGRGILVIGQVAVAMLLLTVAAFIYRGIHSLVEGGPGYRTDHLAMMSFDPPLAHYSPEQTRRFYDQLVERARALAGVKSVSLASMVPMNMNLDAANIVPEGYQLPAGQDSVHLFANRVDEHYFDTMAVPIVRGRGFLKTDASETPRVAVVNETLAERYWPRQNPIGKRFRLNDRNGPWVEIVGVAKNGKYVFISEEPTEFVYLPERQDPPAAMILIAESSADSASLIPPLREMVRSMDANQPIFDVRTMEQLYDARVHKTPAVIVEVVGGMGLMGLALALVGLYGLVTYAVSRRTKEIGIRMAIGANPRGILRMVLGQGAKLAVFGVLAGIALSLGAHRLLTGVFPAGQQIDLATYLIVLPAVLAITLLAAYVPARRASRTDPIRALRYE